MTDVTRRAFNTPPKQNKEIAGKRKRPGAPEKYRGIEYSIAPAGEGQWAWKLHAEIKRGTTLETSGTKKGKKTEAIEAACRAIDKMLGT